MIKANNISVIVITKNRVSSLQRLFLSLSMLKVKPLEIIVVSSSDQQKEEKFLLMKFSDLNIILISESRNGYSIARNRGIKASSGSIIAFVDDDCTVPPDWVEKIVLAHNRVGEGGIVMGSVTSLPTNNFWAQVSQMHYDSWVSAVCGNGNCTTLDAKVTSFDKNIFIKRHFWFDDSFDGGSEDIEFGYRLYQAGLVIYYDPSVHFYHHERTSLRQVIRQRWRIATGEVVVAQRIGDFELVDILPPTKLKHLVSRASKKMLLWIKTKNIWWSIAYVGMLPIFFATRVLGYWWGNRK